MKKDTAVIVLNKTFSVVTNNGCVSHQYSSFKEEVSKFNEITLSCSNITLRTFNKYREIIFSLGFDLGNIAWADRKKIGSTDVMTARISFYKK